MKQSYGFLEVTGYAAALKCADIMIKTAYITISHMERIGSGLVTIMIEGDLASVQAAIEAGIESAESSLLTANVIARPYEGFLNVTNQTKEGSDG
ncbi:hypothetical protein KP77_28110 [Jeotgalibacillus alimentarius]|uniref:BMC domain-containing protein n=1 Tax=Jeotgalibacillus alimentarius TaxID=135826 RepID=A0A0C2RY24_9BACL|nr:BMC domain-containing protein [Jeotgalibacillus alimentarius]KIL46684.1 hypothetical protein KP77_28110 [Jeotgalibacillus alimentarius]